MSTRCNIHFDGWGEVRANVYRHSDGYPEGQHGVLADLQRFFKDVELQCNGDTRFDDPEYLAAKFIVWQAHALARNTNHPLDFLGLGVCVRDHGDIEYVYTVNCDKLDHVGHPTVTVESS